MIDIILFLILLFIIIPLTIGISTSIATYLSVILMNVSVFMGGSIHNLFNKKIKQKWHSPAWLSIIQILIIQGLIYGIIARIVGSSFNWSWLSTIGSAMTTFSISMLTLDLIILIILSTIHGKFEVLE